MTYTLNQELLIDKLAKTEIRNLHDCLQYRKDNMSKKQEKQMRIELEQCQALLYQNRLNRQLGLR